MLSWLFKKRSPVGISPTGKAQAAAPPAPTAPAPPKRTVPPAPPAPDSRVEDAARLREALGDDAALLQLAQSTVGLEVKLAAVQAITGEAALKQAERAFRSHDRRVHRVAKQRLDAAVAAREAGVAAQRLIDTVEALAAEPVIAVNRVVELDRDWNSIDSRLLDPDVVARFSALRSRLDEVLREQGQRQQHLQRWMSDAKQALAECPQRLIDGATGSAADLAAQRAAFDTLRSTRPDASVADNLDAALAAAQQAMAAVEARVAWLDRPWPPLAAPSDKGDADRDVTDVPVDTNDRAESADPAALWQALPTVPDSALARVLDERFAAWQRAHAPTPPAATRAPTPPKHARPAPRRASADDHQRLEALVEQAEAALAEGRLAPAQQHVQAADTLVELLQGALVTDTLRDRHLAARAECQRLQGWQRWGGGLARDDLAAEAEALARITAAASEAPAAPKLRLQEHAEAIRTLRLRWKELDRLGAPASQTLWQRFDAALQLAHEPVALHQATLKAARQDNLAAREALLATLEAVPLPHELADGGAPGEPRWKEPLAALGAFQAAWRPLGPLEHTVPAAARPALQQRLRSALERIETPLEEARRAAEAARERLIADAAALSSGVGRTMAMPEATQRVRELQAEWQQQARSLPLARGVENALWTRFKAATDAVFAQREAIYAAREAEIAADIAAREALIERLAALAGDTPTAAFERTLAEVERAWRSAPELPRGAAGSLETRLRDAHAAALQRRDAAAQARWHAECDGLAAKLALCIERETAAPDRSEFEPRWATLGALPARWEQALALRWSGASAASPLAPEAVDERLLQLEATLDLPAAPEWQEARRRLKLRAMKDSLEGRAAPAGGAPGADALVAVLRQDRLTAAQRDRLHALVLALRDSPAGTLADPAPPASTRRS